MIRPAKIDDIQQIVDLAFWVAGESYPSLLPSRRKIARMATELVSSASQFVWVSVEGGHVKGVLAASVDDIFWAERKQAVVVMFYCAVPGDGSKLLREFLSWARGRRAIKLITVGLDFPHDPRLDDMVKRFGLTRRGGIFTEYR